MIRDCDYRPEYHAIRDEIDAALSRVLDSGRLILGDEVHAFESEFAAWVGAREAVGVANGTDALTLALRALDIGTGDEVLTVANAGVPTVAAIRAAGALPRFVDVDPHTLLLDPAALDGALTPLTRAIVPVHLYGRAADVEGIAAFAARHDLALVEDCAQAHGTRHGARHVGTFGQIGCFSFYPTKNLGAFGDGGACVTDDSAIAERLRRLRRYGFDDERQLRLEGLNSRLDELQAAILRVKLDRLDTTIAERRRLAARYVAGLEGSRYALTAAQNERGHAFHLFVVRAPQREPVLAALAAAGIGYGIHYPEPVHRMEPYVFLGQAAGSLPVSEEACRTVLSLPLYPGLAPADVDRVVEVLRGVEG